MTSPRARKGALLLRAIIGWDMSTRPSPVPRRSPPRWLTGHDTIQDGDRISWSAHWPDGGADKLCADPWGVRGDICNLQREVWVEEGRMIAREVRSPCVTPDTSRLDSLRWALALRVRLMAAVGGAAMLGMLLLNFHPRICARIKHLD